MRTWNLSFHYYWSPLGGLLLAVYRPWSADWIRRTSSQHVSDGRSAAEQTADAETRSRGRRAALKRQVDTADQQAARATRLRQQRHVANKRNATVNCEAAGATKSAVSSFAPSPTSVEAQLCQSVNLFSAPLLPDTQEASVSPLPEVIETKFYHMSNLHMAEMAATILAQLSAEFMPIIQRRGYRVSSVSEMCCCGDGLVSSSHKENDTAAGNDDDHNNRTIVPKEKIQHMCGQGYNCIKVISRGVTLHAIHLRLRHPDDHTVLLGYDHAVEVVSRFTCLYPSDTRPFISSAFYIAVTQKMCHGLAHCRHSHHTDSFFKLAEQIKQEYAARLSNDPRALEKYFQTEQAFGGFNVYQSTLRPAWFAHYK